MWIGWIKWYISMVRFSILIIGAHINFFQRSRRLGPRGHFFPYLFVMVALNYLLKKAWEEAFFSIFKVGSRGNVVVEVSHLLFAKILPFFVRHAKIKCSS